MNLAPYYQPLMGGITNACKCPQCREAYRDGLLPPRYPVPSTLGPVTQGLTTNTLVLWPADEHGPALEIWGNGSLTFGEIIGLHPKAN